MSSTRIQLALQVKTLGVGEPIVGGGPDSERRSEGAERLDLNWITDDVLAAARKGR
jgi:hypothetical protein